jgi:glycosyltransferase involved in cell wall biosynthesis
MSGVFFWHDARMSERSARTPSISCVMPAYNEARNLDLVVPQVLAALAKLSPQIELILIDDGSRDDTVQVARHLCGQYRELVLIELSRNFGKEAALTAGIDAARGEVVVLMDADGQHPASLLGEMLQKWKQGADVVYAVRRTREDQSRLQAGLTGLFYKLVNWGNRIEIPAHAGDFRLMDQRVVQALRALPERNRFMKGLYAWVGFSSAAIDYEPLPRADGQTNYGLGGSLRLALTGMVAFSTAPLRLLTALGLLLAVGALGYGSWVIIDHFRSGIAVPGYATIVVGMMFFSGIQLLGLGILAEYVGRIYDEVKQRPPYLINRRSGAGLAATRVEVPSPAQVQDASLL